MGETSNKRVGLVFLGALALALSSCGTPAAAPAADAPSAQAATAASTATPTPESGPAAVVLDPQMLEGLPGKAQTDSDKQMMLAQEYISQMVKNKYTLSGGWSNDGNSPADIAKLWANYFSPELQEKLKQVGKTGDANGYAAWAIFALGSPDSSDQVKASPACAASRSDMCSFLEDKQNGTKALAGDVNGIIDTSVPNKVSFDYDVAVPVSLKDQGNAEGVLSGVLKVNLSFVPNPSPGPGKPDFLINSVNNVLEGTKVDLLTAHPELSPV